MIRRRDRLISKVTILFTLILLGSIWGSFSVAEEGSNSAKPKNIILLIGDGMGLGQITVGMNSSFDPLPLSKFPIVGFQKTYAFNDIITDSAAGATAIACGKKTYRSAVGVNSDTVKVQSILEEAELRNLATGLAVTSSIVHATPAAFYAHQPLRNFYEDIALDLSKVEVDFLVGGGKSYFHNHRNDGRNLLEEMEAKGYDIFDIERKSLHKIKMNPERNICYFTAPKQPPGKIEGRNYLPIAAKRAIEHLSQQKEEGFFLMIEGSQIDWAGHANETSALLPELDDFSKTIQEVLKFASENQETLVILTADHETGGLAINPKSKKKRLRLEYTTNNHTGTMVPVFAYGPQAELFSGIYDNTEIYHKMRQAFGWKKVTESSNFLNSK